MEKNSVGKVEKKFFTFASDPNDRFVLESGIRFGPVTIAYETYGELNGDKSNAILIQHTLTMDSHAAGFYDESDREKGWWDGLIGPGKAFDTDKYFIISSNVLGGCGGSTGPSSINPLTNGHYGMEFPFIVFSDMIRCQKKLVESFGIKKLFAVAGGSMGGMLALQWVADFPDMVGSVISISAAWKQSPMQIALSEVARQAVMKDPEWENGNYYFKELPKRGLAIARMIGHITYMSDLSMEKKFSRNLKNGSLSFSFETEFEVESYLHKRGKAFAERFDANSFLYITRALNYFDVSGEKLTSGIEVKKTRFLLLSFESDWLYPSRHSEEIAQHLEDIGISYSYFKVESFYGHDAFLLELEKESELIENFLMEMN